MLKFFGLCVIEKGYGNKRGIADEESDEDDDEEDEDEVCGTYFVCWSWCYNN